MSGSSSILGIYFGIFIFGLFFQFIGALDAYRTTNTMQVVAVGVFNFLGVAYAIVQINQVVRFKNCVTTFVSIISSTVANSTDQLKQVFDLESSSCYFKTIDYSNGNYSIVARGKSLANVANAIDANLDLFNLFPPFQYVILATMLFGSLTGVYFAYKSYQQVGWHNFTVHGADIQKKKLLQRFHLFMLCLKVNGFFFMVIAAQYIMQTYFTDKNTKSNSAMILVVSFIVVTVIFVIYYLLGTLAMKKSNYLLVGLFLLLVMINFLVSAIVLWRIYFQAINEFQSSRIWLSVFLSVQIVSNIITYIISILLILDFKKGLLDVVSRMERKNTANEAQEKESGRRFTLD